MSNAELKEFILQTSKSELMNLLLEVSSTMNLHELEDAICRILALME